MTGAAHLRTAHDAPVPDWDSRSWRSSVWDVVGASVVGESHRASGDPRQDAFAAELIGECAVLAVADGLGSSVFAHVGAQLAADTMVRRLAAVAGLGAPDLDGHCIDGRSWRDVVFDALSDIRAALQPTEAVIDGVLRTLYDTTLLAAVVHPNGGLFIHVGDGAGLVCQGCPAGSLDNALLSSPENGLFDNETFPITLPDITPHVRFTSFGPTDVVMLMTDGVTPFAFEAAGGPLRPRFLQPIDRHLSGNAGPEGAQALASTLDGPELRRNHGDDKTLLWARVRPEAQP